MAETKVKEETETPTEQTKRGATAQQVKAINKALEILKRRAWMEL